MKTCALCFNEVRDTDDTAKEVVGWVGGPKKDSMRLRRDTGAVAHESCVQIVAAGQDPTQPDLFADDHPIVKAAAQNTAAIENLEELL